MTDCSVGLLESLNDRFSKNHGSGTGPFVDPLARDIGWGNVWEEICVAFRPRGDWDVCPDSVYGYMQDVLWGIREMFRDVLQATLDTIEMDVSNPLVLVVEPHDGGGVQTHVVVYYGDRVLYHQKFNAFEFDFDDERTLEVFMQSVRRTVVAKLKDAGYIVAKSRKE